MSFQILPMKGQSESKWAVRLWEHQYYEFRYTFPLPGPDPPRRKGILVGQFMSPKAAPDVLTEQPVNDPTYSASALYSSSNPGDSLLATISGHGSRFEVTTRLHQDSPHAGCGTRDGFDVLHDAQKPQKMMLYDENETRRAYGSVAFLSGSSGDVQVVFESLSGSGKERSHD